MCHVTEERNPLSVTSQDIKSPEFWQRVRNTLRPRCLDSLYTDVPNTLDLYSALIHFWHQGPASIYKHRALVHFSTKQTQRTPFLIRLIHDRSAAIFTSNILVSKQNTWEKHKEVEIKSQENSERQRSEKTVEETQYNWAQIFYWFFTKWLLTPTT